MSQELDADQKAAVEKIEKLLRLAARNPSQEEAARAAAKAQELLEAYNLDASLVSADGDSSGRREKARVKGGMYQYQRDLWRAVAELNFCMYFTLEVPIVRQLRRRDWDGTMRTVEVHGKEFHHQVIGRVVNTAGTRVMGQYLEQTIERLVKEEYPLNSQRFMREAVAYREGMAYAVTQKLQDRRRTVIEQEEARQASELARRGISTATALTLGSLSKQEHEANQDFVYGEGFSARRAAARAEQARAQREAEEAYTRWAEANPEEARAEEEKRRKEAERAAKRRRGGSGSRGGQPTWAKRMQSGSFWRGHDAGKSVGIDPQTDRSKPQERLS